MLMTWVKELWHQRKNNLRMFAFTTDSISAISLSLQTPRCFINVSFNKKKSSSRVKTRRWNDLKRERNDSKTLSYKARRTKGSIKIKRFKKKRRNSTNLSPSSVPVELHHFKNVFNRAVILRSSPAPSPSISNLFRMISSRQEKNQQIHPF